MKPKTMIWVAVGIVAALVVAFNLFKPAAAGITNVDAAGVETAMKQPGVQVIDVRSAGEFQMGHIPGAINVPVETIGAAAESWDRDGTYVVYCATGARSASAVETMKAMGFKNIRHFNAGIQAWNGTLDKGGQTTAAKVETDGKPVLIEFYTDS